MSEPAILKILGRTPPPIALSQAKVAMGMKRKAELEVEADKVKKKMAKAEKAIK